MTTGKNRVSKVVAALCMGSMVLGMQSQGLDALAVTLSDNSVVQGSQPVVCADRLDTVPESNCGVTVYSGALQIAALSSEDFTKSSYQVDWYDTNRNYYLRVVLAEDEHGEPVDCVFYKLNHETELWEYHYDTRVQDKTAYVAVTSLDCTETTGYTVSCNGEEILTVSDEDWYEGYNPEFPVDVLHSSDYLITFAYADGRQVQYGVVGRDVDYIGEVTPPPDTEQYTGYAWIPVSAAMGDVLEMYGVLPDGSTYTDVFIVGSTEQGVCRIPLPDGQFTVLNRVSRLFAQVLVDNTNRFVGVSDGGVNNEDGSQVILNLSVPEIQRSYKVYTADGTVLEEGIQADGSLTESVQITAADIRKYGAYVLYEVSVGVINSTDPREEFYTTEGYITYTGNMLNAGAIQPYTDGDVDGDGVLSLLDIIRMQRYLHKQTTLSVSEVIRGDMLKDGRVDVFDLALLKRQLLYS